MPKLLKGDMRSALNYYLTHEPDVQLTVTSPPYNVGWDYEGDETSDRIPIDEYVHNFLHAALEKIYWATRDGGVIALNLPPSIRVPENKATGQQEIRAYPLASKIECLMHDIGWMLRGTVTWVKSRPGAPVRATTTAIGNYKNPHLRHCHERIILASKGAFQIPERSPRWPGSAECWTSYMEMCKDVWVLPPGRATRGKPLRFPWEMVANLIYLYSNPGDIVMDPFAGSGSVGEVARAMGRDFLLVEKNPNYVANLQALVDSPPLTTIETGVPNPNPSLRTDGTQLAMEVG
jgi:DNA modification methylase